MKSLLIIEDDPHFGAWLCQELSAQYCVSWCQTGNEGITQAVAVQPDVILLDLHLPDISGFQIVSSLPANSRFCVITGSVDLDDKLRSYGLGAEDVILKPFTMEELFCRIKVILRHTSLTANAWELDDVGSIIRQRGISLPLSPKEYDVFRYLMHRPDTVVSRSELIDAIWKCSECFPNTVDATVERLRRKLFKTFGRNCIKTAYGRGYFLDGRA
jgi:two-component system phosphate regulon response regulator PhoB